MIIMCIASFSDMPLSFIYIYIYSMSNIAIRILDVLHKYDNNKY